MSSKRIMRLAGVWIVIAIAIATAVYVGRNTDDESARDITVRDAWVRATVPEMAATESMGGMATMEAVDTMTSLESDRVTAAYMIIENPSDDPDRLLSASSEIAATVEIHETTMDGEVMHMRPVEDGVTVPANGQVELKPRGLHIMLMGVRDSLEPGDTVTLTLKFESGRTITVEAPVRPLE